MRLLAKMQGRLVEAPPSVDDQGISVETTAVPVLPNGAGKCHRRPCRLNLQDIIAL
jgi:hypothetical protein